MRSKVIGNEHNAHNAFKANPVRERQPVFTDQDVTKNVRFVTKNESLIGRAVHAIRNAIRTY